MKKTVNIAFFSAFIFLLTVLSSYGFRSYTESRNRLVKRSAAWREAREKLFKKAKSFKGQVCFVIKDLEMGWEASYNPDAPVPSASIVKIPVMACCLDSVYKGELDKKEELALKACSRVSGSGTLKGKPIGTKVCIDRLLDLMITQSDNTAANMIIGIFGFRELNHYFEYIGLKNTNISRFMMDMKSRARGVENYTTARDMAGLLEKIYEGKLGSKAMSSDCMELLKKQHLRDRIPKELPRDTVVAHKTGLERHVCHDVGIVFTGNGDFLIAVLTKHNNKNSRPSKKIIADLALVTYEYYEGMDS